LPVVEDRGGGVQGQGAVGDHTRVVPALALVPVDLHHVVGEVGAEAGILQDRLDLLRGGAAVVLGDGEGRGRRRRGHGTSLARSVHRPAQRIQLIIERTRRPTCSRGEAASWAARRVRAPATGSVPGWASGPNWVASPAACTWSTRALSSCTTAR